MEGVKEMTKEEVRDLLLKGSREISFEPKEHTYTDGDGNLYLPVSDLISQYKNPFEKGPIACACAKKRMKETGIPTTTEDILAEWDKTAKESQEWGTSVHAYIESFINGTKVGHPYSYQIDKHLGADVIIPLFLMKENEDYILKSECILFDLNHLICGTADILIYDIEKDVIHIWDLKTNDKIDRVAGYWRKGDSPTFVRTNKAMKEGLSHLEDCNFNHYQLQLSIYAYLLELLGFKVKSLCLIHYPWKPNKNPDTSVTFLPCNYLKKEVEYLFQKRKEVLCM